MQDSIIINIRPIYNVISVDPLQKVDIDSKIKSAIKHYIKQENKANILYFPLFPRISHFGEYFPRRKYRPGNTAREISPRYFPDNPDMNKEVDRYLAIVSLSAI